MSYTNFTTNIETSAIEAINIDRAQALARTGVDITPLAPIGAVVRGLDLASEASPPEDILRMLELEMAQRGFIAFKSPRPLSVDDFLSASCWWGGRELHSTHGVHPATPQGNPHVFRLSNDPRHGIPGVGPQWHNDGSFNDTTFSHSGYHMVRPAEQGGGTWFAHQGAAYEALPKPRQEFWRRLSSVNSTSGAVHPAVHTHPLSGQQGLWLHLGMTGAVIEKQANEQAFRLLDADELRQLCHEYNDILNAGLENGYSVAYEYEANDCVFIDNLAVAHRAAPQAHLSAEQQGLRIMHRSTVRGVSPLAPDYGLPQYLDISDRSPFGEGVWQFGGIGFRWDDSIPMQN
ncbi:TauD/TfdA dioxygenase family protein [Congregibacter sp.]|uniref:TauD/TfdA dioxygenase family protein n=1 Tax=Congregibacter sp. TaxID=2744308 RepID=UPI003F6A71C0